MEYKGKLYGKAGEVVFPLLHTTDDWEAMENKIADLEAQIESQKSAIPIVSVTAWVFYGNDTNGRDVSIYIEAPDRESAISYFESDYEGYRYWQTRQLHSR